MTIAPSLKIDVERLGYAVLPKLLDAGTLDRLRAEADQLLATASQRGGVRNALGKSGVFTDLALSGPPALVAQAVLGDGTRPTKLTIFDKTPSANWKVPWHQDLTISVRQRCEASGFGPWSIKDGVPHVQPPAHVLDQILAIRVHLDDTPADNGALRVLPGSHRAGRLADDQVSQFRASVTEVVCTVPAGGAMLMRPLLLHASSTSAAPSRRRVLHFEYSALLLPESMAWA